jgi:hypothetical protein
LSIPQHGELATILRHLPLVLQRAYAHASIALRVTGARMYSLLDNTALLDDICRCSGIVITSHFIEFDKRANRGNSSARLTLSVVCCGISPRNPRYSLKCRAVSSPVSFLSKMLIDPIDPKLLIDSDRPRFASPKIEHPPPPLWKINYPYKL